MSARPLPPPTPGPLLPWLVAVLAPMSRTKVKQLLAAGRVQVNGQPVTRHDHPLSPADRVALGPPRERTPAGFGLPVVFADPHLIAVDKPAGLLTVATDREKLDTAFARLAAGLAAERAGRPAVVHRLDRDTSGLLLFARSPAVRDRLQADWAGVAKTYLAVVEGSPPDESGTVDNFLAEGKDLRVRAVGPAHPAAKRAVSHYRVVGRRDRLTLVEVVIPTGRKHQIRAHLSGLGCPVVGDRAYGAATDPAGRLGLHAWKLSFPHPVGGSPVELTAGFPKALAKLTGERPA